MGQFMGRESYDLPNYCKQCDEFYEEDEQHCCTTARDGGSFDMNLYKPPQGRLENWAQWVMRLSREKEELNLRNRRLEDENLDLKRRCCELYEDLCEEKRKGQ